MTPDEIAEQLDRLRDAGKRLKRRPIGEVLDVLGAVLDSWSDPNSSWRRDLEDRLPAATGFTASLVGEGLRRALGDWTSDALRTGDLGRAVLDGFEVIGREPGADARGCSIGADMGLGRRSP